jgi:protocatechuate 3,4-dioxygenase beta subunit
VEEGRFTVRTDQDGRYVFTKIPPGAYKLTNTVAGPPLWRLRVTIAPGRETTLDLNNGNSLTVRDDFPQG